MPRKWFEGNIISVVDEGINTKRFFIKIEEEDYFDFKAGQFITLDLPIGEKRLARWRSYSIANTPNNDNILELCIVRLEGGAAGKWFFEVAEIGSKVKFKGPDGGFVLPQSIDKNLVMICTGTGVAPFRSMIHQLKSKDIAHKDIHLIFGTRFEKGILYHQEWEETSNENDDFRVSYALSREEKEGYHHGYVHDIYLEEYKYKPLENYIFYLCGWSRMIDDAVENLLLKLKVPKENIKYELYG